MDICKGCGMLKKRCRCNNPKFQDTTITYSNNKLDSKVKKNKNKFLSNKHIPKHNENDFSKKNNDLKIIESNFSKLKKEYPYIDEEIIKNFPFDKPRKGQLEIISKIDKAIEDGVKFIILEAGTGTGKSIIAATLARMYKSTYILTMTKQLQQQYLKDFSKYGFLLVKGRGNFDCKYKINRSDKKYKTFSCSFGKCVNTSKFECYYGYTVIADKSKNIFNLEKAFKNKYWRSSSYCHYLDQKVEAINADTAIMNYDYALNVFNHTTEFSKRQLLILDEAHNVEEKIMDFVEFEILSEKLLKDINMKITKEDIDYIIKSDFNYKLDFIEDILLRYRNNYETIKEKYKKKSEDKLLTKMKENEREVVRYGEFKKLFENNHNNWVMIRSDNNINFKPITVNDYCKDFLFKNANTCLFMSGTILDAKLFAKWLGIKEDEYMFISEKTPFKPENRPIILDLVGKLSKNYKEATKPKTIPKILEIFEKHKNEKGLIHTNSYEFQKYINSKIKDKRVMVHQSYNREAVLEKFRNDDTNKVLISPSLSEGVDLPYNNCRFQIIYKTPFPYLGDEQIKQRKKLEDVWYYYQTIIDLAQEYGRIMRAEDDAGTTYIIDENVNMLLNNRYNYLVPEFIKEAIKYN